MVFGALGSETMRPQFIAFQEHGTGKGGGMWSRMFGYFQYRRGEFLAHYHKRSTVETTFHG